MLHDKFNTVLNLANYLLLIVVFVVGIFFGRCGNNRYQVSGSRDDKGFVIDTRTGEVWHYIENNHDASDGFFKPVFYKKWSYEHGNSYLPLRR